MVITEIDYSERFLEALKYLHNTYKKFPKFMIEIIAENYEIPPAEIKALIYLYTKNGMLKIIKNEGYYYQLDLFD
ncbi:MAG: hypothetical protein ACFFFB_10240 [Candidatus Heimdallarchaeota archaeon]